MRARGHGDEPNAPVQEFAVQGDMGVPGIDLQPEEAVGGTRRGGETRGVDRSAGRKAPGARREPGERADGGGNGPEGGKGDGKRSLRSFNSCGRIHPQAREAPFRGAARPETCGVESKARTKFELLSLSRRDRTSSCKPLRDGEEVIGLERHQTLPRGAPGPRRTCAALHPARRALGAARAQRQRQELPDGRAAGPALAHRRRRSGCWDAVSGKATSPSSGA